MRSTRLALALAGLACVLTATLASAQTMAAPAPAVRDGAHDFDWMVGTWKAHLKRLENPLTGSTKWVEFDGVQRTWLAWGGRSAMDEFTVEDAATKTRIDALTVRPGLGLVPFLVDVHAAQWGTLNRVMHAVLTRTGPAEGWAIDEHTTLETTDGVPVAVHGTGAAARVRRATAETVEITIHVSGPIR